MLKALICLPQIPQIFADIIFVSESSEAKTLGGLEKILVRFVFRCVLCAPPSQLPKQTLPLPNVPKRGKYLSKKLFPKLLPTFCNFCSPNNWKRV
jgi:hypothetical protein